VAERQPLPENVSWEICLRYVADHWFTPSNRPAPEELGELLEELGVSVSQVEDLVTKAILKPGKG
jgi:hypothetical protein